MSKELVTVTLTKEEWRRLIHFVLIPGTKVQSVLNSRYDIISKIQEQVIGPYLLDDFTREEVHS